MPRGERVWEYLGLSMGMLGCFSIFSQIIAEWRLPERSSLSFVNLSGFVLVYVFWTAYGWKFKRTAVWLGNIIASSLQLFLLLFCLWKVMRF